MCSFMKVGLMLENKTRPALYPHLLRTGSAVVPRYVFPFGESVGYIYAVAGILRIK